MKILFVSFYLDFTIKSLEMFEFGVLKGLHFRMGFLIIWITIALWQYELASFHDRDTKLETYYIL